MERTNIINYRVKEGINTIMTSNNNKIVRDSNNNQENNLGESSATTRSKLGWYGNVSTGTILCAGIFTGSEDASNANNNKHNNNETVNL